MSDNRWLARESRAGSPVPAGGSPLPYEEPPLAGDHEAIKLRASGRPL
jgi:hypothetical protein